MKASTLSVLLLSALVACSDGTQGAVTIPVDATEVAEAKESDAADVADVPEADSGSDADDGAAKCTIVEEARPYCLVNTHPDHLWYDVFPTSKVESAEDLSKVGCIAYAPDAQDEPIDFERERLWLIESGTMTGNAVCTAATNVFDRMLHCDRPIDAGYIYSPTVLYYSSTCCGYHIQAREDVTPGAASLQYVRVPVEYYGGVASTTYEYLEDPTLPECHDWLGKWAEDGR